MCDNEISDYLSTTYHHFVHSDCKMLRSPSLQPFENHAANYPPYRTITRGCVTKRSSGSKVYTENKRMCITEMECGEIDNCEFHLHFLRSIANSSS